MDERDHETLAYSSLDASMWQEYAPRFQGGVLDLSGPQFRLETLRGLEQLCKDEGLRPEQALLRHNHLQSLVELAAFNVKTVDASHNRIAYLCARPEEPTLNKWPSKMQALTQLDLSFNQLTQIPGLGSMPNLRVLVLATNNITHGSFGNLAEGKQLETLDLQNNQLDWRSEGPFVRAAAVFAGLTRLRTVTLSGNRVVDSVPDYHFVILAHLRSRRKLTGSHPIQRIDEHAVNREMKGRADAKRRKMLADGGTALEPLEPSGSPEGPEERKPGDGLLDELLPQDERKDEPSELAPIDPRGDLGPGGQGAHHANGGAGRAVTGLLPTLIELNAMLDECFAHPARCVGVLDEMTRDVHYILDRPQDHQFLFNNFELGQSVDLVIDEFLQNVVLLSERQPQAVDALLRILVYLSTVRVHGLGTRCVQQLRDLMGSGERHAIEVIGVINDFLVPLLDRAPNRETLDLIMQNLIDLASCPNVPDDLDRSPLDNALPFIAANLRRAGGSPPEDLMLHLAAVASDNWRIAQRLGGAKVASHLAVELVEAKVNTKRYLSLLVCIKNMARLDVLRQQGHAQIQDAEQDLNDRDDDDDDALAAGAQDLVHVSEQEILAQRQRLDFRSATAFAKVGVHREILKNVRVLVDEKERSGSNVADVLIRESVLCLAALSHANAIFVDLMDSRLGYFALLFQLHGMAGSGPVILSAVFRALTTILNAPADWYPLRYDDVVFEKSVVFAEVTRRLHRVVPLLQYLGEKGTKFLPMCNLVPKEERQLYFRGERKCVSNLRSPSMFGLLVSVIDLITVYNREASTPGNHLAVRITHELNQAKREAYLFTCLNTPSDDVRLAVVRCLQEIQLHEFDHQEINYLVELLSNVINISSGKTEEVLGGSFRLLNKLCISGHSAGASFRANFAEKSASAALSILERNEMRDTRNQVVESMQKRILSTACVQFLQACSQFKMLSNFLRSHDVLEKMIAILFIEDNNAADVCLTPRLAGEISRTAYRPSLVERTLCGRQVEYLLRTLVGYRSVSPLRVVASRILRRIADVLMGVPDPSLAMLRRQWGIESPAGGEEEDALVLAGAANDQRATSAKDLAAASRYPAWVCARLEDMTQPNVSFRGLTNRLAQRENEMPEFWNQIMGSQVGCSDNWVDTSYGGGEELRERLQQHQLLIHFSGLERLLLFLVGAVEQAANGGRGLSGAQGGGGGGSGGGGLGGMGASDGALGDDGDGLPSSLSISKLLSAFEVQDARAVLEDVLARSEAAQQSASGGGGGQAAAAMGPGMVGKELLLRYFIQESVERAQTATAGRPNNEQQASKKPRDGVEGDEADDGSRAEEYPDADTVMFAPDAAAQFHQETEVSETLVAGLRLIYALLRFGSAETVEAAMKTLRIPAKLRILAGICAGAPERPTWAQNLVGARFMAICYHLCVMPGIRREISLEMLNVFSIVCAVGRRIMSTLRFFAETRALTEEDFIIGMHTTRTLALIAAQLKCVRIPPAAGAGAAAGQADAKRRQLGLGVISRMLMPFQSTIKGCIALLLASFRVPAGMSGGGAARSSGGGGSRGGAGGDGSRATPASAYAEQGTWRVGKCIREHVTLLLVSMFGLDQSSRYEVLEELVRTQIHDRAALQSAYLQELLNRVALASFGKQLEGFMVREGYFAPSQEAPKHGQQHDAENGGIDDGDGEEGFGGRKHSDQRLITKPSPPPTGFFSFCAAPRAGKAAVAKATPVRDPAAFVSNSVVGSDGVKRKTWLLEPPAALSRDSLAKRATHGGDRQAWEYDRVGTERILFSSFADAYESGMAPKRRLIVLTSEAYYMFGEAREGKGWGVLFSADSHRSEDDLFTNPVLFASPAVLQREEGQRPQLLWRKPYRAVERVILGLYGERLHLLHRDSDIPGNTAPTTLTLVLYVSGAAIRMHATLMQMCREWAKVEASLGVEPARIKVPPVERDLSLEFALETVLGKIDIGDAREAAPAGRRLPHASRLLQLGEATGLFNSLDGILFSQVQLVLYNGTMAPRAIVCTNKQLAILEAHWEHWTFPNDFAAERDRFLASLDARASGASGGGGGGGGGGGADGSAQNSTAEESTRSRIVASMNAHIEAKIERERQQRRKILRLDSRNRNTFSLLDLNEVFVDRGESPVMTLGFGKKTAQSLLGGGAAAQLGQSRDYYEVVFYDHDTRDQWCARLLPLLTLATAGSG